ncbi:hypothetical protein CA850_01950 [Micromonospora echinospora]|uniref:Uncharacterized protein n=1 Tax=Micromonospora echinospora TaxID=1877 RepID=A0A1C4YC44_MICEC|nr:hypothetical protein [Micromonospora echinospora]OZV84626.1 hypothetical protein CA850_01950 [Micromonospora echinospora]SCF18264.1 hypothetical protein GA0070618_3812 [Micromonospora echinospora]
MLIDCARCEIRHRGCADCLVTVLFDTPEQVAGLGAAEQHAVEVLARAGFEVEILPATVPAAPVRPFRAA